MRLLELRAADGRDRCARQVRLLPHKPVYQFFDAEGTLLYVGKGEGHRTTAWAAISPSST